MFTISIRLMSNGTLRNVLAVRPSLAMCKAYLSDIRRHTDVVVEGWQCCDKTGSVDGENTEKVFPPYSTFFDDISISFHYT